MGEMLVQQVHEVLGLLHRGQDFDQGLLLRNPVIPDSRQRFLPKQFFHFLEVLFGEHHFHQTQGHFPSGVASDRCREPHVWLFRSI
jgi:hypothetical protein